MSSSENPPATKRHKGRHKREALRTAQKGKSRGAIGLWRIGRQASGEGGIRTTPETGYKTAFFAEGGAESGAPTLTTPNIDPDLAALIDAWPNLPDAIRAGILAMIRAAGG